MHSVSRRLRRTAVTALVVACVGGLAGASDAPATTETTPGITINQTVTNGTINSELFGVIMNWPTDAEGAFYAPNGVYRQNFLTVAQQMGIGSVRFVDGTGGREAFEWERAIGPENQRTWNRVVDGKPGQPSTVGPDEIGQLIDDLGAKGVAITNFYRETAHYAADWVAYMTAPTTNTWGAKRAANGHSAPYPIDYFDVGNEQDLVPGGWTTGDNPVVKSPHSAYCNASNLTSSNTPDCMYAFGGTSSFTNQKVVKYASLEASAAVSDGSANQAFYASYPPVKTGQTVKVDGTAWTAVSSLGGGGNIYTIDHTTGEIDFGNGTNGNIPPNGSTITITYDSGPHDGFVDFYNAMKAVNSSISVCAQDSNQAFLDAMGSAYPYDCLAWHGALGDGYPSTSLGDQAFMQAELAAPDTQSTNEQSIQNRVDTAAGKHVPVVLTAYGHKHGNQPSDFPNEHLTLTDGLLEARQLQEWIAAGIPLAHRFMLNDEFFNSAGCPDDFEASASACVNGIIQSDGGSNFVGEPDGLAMGLMAQLAGRTVVGVTTSNDPTITTASGKTIPTLTCTVTKNGSGVVQITVVNQDLTNGDDVSANISFAGGYTHQSTAPVETLNAPGGGAGTVNDENNPTAVKVTTSTASVGSGAFSYTFPAHSVTLITLTQS